MRDERSVSEPAFTDRERGLFVSMMVTLYEWGDKFYAQFTGLYERRMVTYIWQMNLTRNIGPTVTGLAESFGVPRETMRRSISSMIERGILERRKGRQLFLVATPEMTKAYDKAVQLILDTADAIRQRRE